MHGAVDGGPGLRGLASIGPFLGAPAGSPGQVKDTGGTGSGAWHPLTPSWVPSVVCRSTDHGRCGGGSACAYCWGTDRGIPVPQILRFFWCSSWTRLLTYLLRP